MQNNFINLLAAGASVTPIPRTDPGGSLHAGMSVGLEFAPPGAALHGELTYGYSPTAVRGRRRGGQTIAIAFEIDFMTPDVKARKDAQTRQEGLGWLLGR